MAEGTQKSSTAEFILRRIKADAERQRIARQKYQQEYEGGQQTLSWGLKNYLDGLGGLTSGEGINALLKLRGDVGALQQGHPGAIPALVGLISHELKLSPQAVAAALGLPSLSHDALDTLLLATLCALAPEVHNGTLPLARIAAAVNGDCAPNEALTNTLLGQRLHALGFPFTRHHPVSVILIPRLLPPVLDVALTRLLPSPEAPHENGSQTQNTQ